MRLYGDVGRRRRLASHQEVGKRIGEEGREGGAMQSSTKLDDSREVCSSGDKTATCDFRGNKVVVVGRWQRLLAERSAGEGKRAEERSGGGVGVGEAVARK